MSTDAVFQIPENKRDKPGSQNETSPPDETEVNSALTVFSCNLGKLKVGGASVWPLDSFAATRSSCEQFWHRHLNPT